MIQCRRKSSNRGSPPDGVRMSNIPWTGKRSSRTAKKMMNIWPSQKTGMESTSRIIAFSQVSNRPPGLRSASAPSPIPTAEAMTRLGTTSISVLTARPPSSAATGPLVRDREAEVAPQEVAEVVAPP